MDPDISLPMLHKYPGIKNTFIKYNTTISSSTSVERMFSVAGQIQIPRRSSLSDHCFEKLLLLKTNTSSMNGKFL